MSEAVKALVRRFYDAFEKADSGALDTMVAQDFVDHNVPPGWTPGLKGLKDAMHAYHTAFPDIRIVNEDVVIQGDKAVVRSRLRGTHTGPLFGIPATGKPVEIATIDILRVKDGKVVEAWHVEELLQMMWQLGVVPPPGG
jgi:steroid delta-isomerase-like uncharacterized protein